MSTLWIAAILIAAPPGEVAAEQGTPPVVTTAQTPAVQQPLVPLRTGPELRDAVRAALRRWARPSDKEADLAAREFLVLFGELQQDNRLAMSQREELRNKIRGRLLNLAQQINKRVAIQRRLARSKQPESVDAAGKNDVLAQWGGAGRGGMGGPMMGGGMMGGGFGAGPVNDDHGQEQVELIQQTIAPTTWDVNGGPGSIYYWRPGRAIVVRQMGEVHGQIGDVLQQMGKMGR